MYSAEQTKKIQLLTNELITLLKTGPLPADRIEVLREVLRFHENRYYVLSEPLIADVEYDQLYKALEKMENEHPELITPDSPTQRVGEGTHQGFSDGTAPGTNAFA